MIKNSDLKDLSVIIDEIIQKVGSSIYIIVTLGFIAQIANMLSLLLPIKIIMLLGTDLSQDLLPNYLSHLSKEQIIIFLVIFSLIFYLTSLFLNKITDKLCETDFQNSCANSVKIKKDTYNVETSIPSIYSKLAACFSSLLFICLSSIAIIFLYLEVGIIILAFILISLFYLLRSNNTIDIKNITHLCIAATNTVFFLIFIAIIIDFLYFNPPPFIIGIGVLILSRLLLAKITFVVSNLSSICRQEKQINELLFQTFNTIETTSNIDNKTNIWDMLQNTDWLDTVILKLIKKDKLDCTITYLPEGLRGVFFIKAQLDKTHQAFLIKLFDTNFSFLAKKELELFEFHPSGLPSPELLTSGVISNFHYNVFDISNLSKSMLEDNAISKRNFYINLLQIRPNEGLITQKTAHIWERFNSEFLQKLALFLNTSQIFILNELFEKLPHITQILNSQPLKFYIPHRNNLILQNDCKKPVSLHWSNWSIEPLGYGINLTEYANEVDLSSITTNNNHEIVYVISEIEKSYNMNNFHNLFTLLNTLNEKLNTHKY